MARLFLVGHDVGDAGSDGNRRDAGRADQRIDRNSTPRYFSTTQCRTANTNSRTLCSVTFSPPGVTRAIRARSVEQGRTGKRSTPTGQIHD